MTMSHQNKIYFQERAWQKAEGKLVGETHLYFGCRHAAKDFIYRDELEKFVSDDVLTMHTAFSRDGPKKVYVTDKMRENSELLWNLIGEQVHLLSKIDSELQ